MSIGQWMLLIPFGLVMVYALALLIGEMYEIGGWEAIAYMVGVALYCILAGVLM
jgi:hypothetical protein